MLRNKNDCEIDVWEWCLEMMHDNDAFGWSMSMMSEMMYEKDV